MGPLEQDDGEVVVLDPTDDAFAIGDKEGETPPLDDPTSPRLPPAGMHLLPTSTTPAPVIPGPGSAGGAAFPPGGRPDGAPLDDPGRLNALLTELARRGAAALPGAALARSCLTDAGITDALVWAAFRLGAGAPGLLDGLADADRALLRGCGLLPAGGTPEIGGASGFNLPTYDPRDPEHVVGFVRLRHGQHRHAFAGLPAGVGCAVDIGRHDRVVLADGLLLGLRLAQAGVGGVAIVEDAGVLASLASWLADRDIVVASARPRFAEQVRRALGAGARFSVSEVTADLSQTHPVVLAGLGAKVDTQSAAGAQPTRPPVTLRLLRDLHAYAVGRLQDGEGAEILRALGADVPDLASAYRLGFLPETFLDALRSDDQRALGDRVAGGSVVVPAYDSDRVIVDLHVVSPGGNVVRVAEQPAGMMAPEVCRRGEHIEITDSLPWLARRFREGQGDVLLVRDADEARRIAARIAACGVRRVTVQACAGRDEVIDALRGAGIEAAAPTTVDPAPATAATTATAPQASPHRPAVATTTVPAPTVNEPPQPALVLVEDDRKNRILIYEAGPLRYAVQSRDDGDTRRRVVMRGRGDTHSDTIDLANGKQRERYAGGAARRVGSDPATIGRHLAALHDLVLAHEAAVARGPVIEVGAADRATGDAMLSAPDLCAQIAADLTALGFVGEDRSKTLLYLVGVSRMLAQPLWAVDLAAAGAAPWAQIGLIAALTPPEDVVVFRRLTEALLAQSPADALRHRLLLVDQAETLRPEAAMALRILRERSAVGLAGLASGPGGRPLVGEARGPVAVLAAAGGEVDPRCRGCFLRITVDESPEQTALVLAEQRRRRASPAVPADAARIIARHHAAQRLLERARVVIPYADRIAFPATSVRHRDEQSWLLGLIEASALLHQRQRGRDGAAIVADERDFEIAVDLTRGLIGAGGDGLTAGARRLLERISGAGLASFTMHDLGPLMPDWTRHAYRAAIQELLDLGHIERRRAGRGRVGEYAVTARAGVGDRRGGIFLRDADEVVGGLAEVGGNDVANFTPDQAAV